MRDCAIKRTSRTDNGAGSCGDGPGWWTGGNGRTPEVTVEAGNVAKRLPSATLSKDPCSLIYQALFWVNFPHLKKRAHSHTPKLITHVNNVGYNV